jgi:hypothetical protein
VLPQQAGRLAPILAHELGALDCRCWVGGVRPCACCYTLCCAPHGMAGAAAQHCSAAQRGLLPMCKLQRGRHGRFHTRVFPCTAGLHRRGGGAWGQLAFDAGGSLRRLGRRQQQQKRTSSCPAAASPGGLAAAGRHEDRQGPSISRPSRPCRSSSSSPPAAMPVASSCPRRPPACCPCCPPAPVPGPPAPPPPRSTGAPPRWPPRSAWQPSGSTCKRTRSSWSRQPGCCTGRRRLWRESPLPAPAAGPPGRK